MFKKKPMCEVCGEKEATSFSFIPTGNDLDIGNGKFTCECTSNEEKYYIPISDFFSSPSATIDWLAHLQEKPWVDWNNFMKMMDRFRTSTESFNFLH